jgi:hypothetical protein
MHNVYMWQPKPLSHHSLSHSANSPSSPALPQSKPIAHALPPKPPSVPPIPSFSGNYASGSSDSSPVAGNDGPYVPSVDRNGLAVSQINLKSHGRVKDGVVREDSGPPGSTDRTVVSKLDNDNNRNGCVGISPPTLLANLPSAALNCLGSHIGRQAPDPDDPV